MDQPSIRQILVFFFARREMKVLTQYRSQKFLMLSQPCPRRAKNPIAENIF